jgi:hypothetical protein
MVRLTYYEGDNKDQFAGYLDLPDNCSVRTAERSLASRGWVELDDSDNSFDDGKSRMISEHGMLVVIEEVVVDGTILQTVVM